MNDKRGNGSTYEYDPTGRLTKRTWARGIETEYTYNPQGQLTTITYSDLDTPDVAFTYNRMGQQTTVTDATGTRCFAYDTSLQLIQETNWLATLDRTYDTLGRPTALTLGTNYTVSYTYDLYSRLSSVADFTYTYLPHSDLIASVNNGLLQTTTTYEPHRNLKTSISNIFDGSLISSFGYTYDAIGRRTERLDSNTITNEFAYNPRSELVSAQMGTNTYDYAYDPIGNRQKAIANTQSNLYQSNELNQYTNITPTPEALTYDLDGNMLSDGTWNYTWDAENRLVCVAPAGTNVESVCISFAYDYMSRRISKTTDITTNTFTYDNWNLISESSTAHTNNYYYIWGLDLSTTLQGAGGVGGLLAQACDNTPPLYFVCDGNGNITETVDINGAVTAHFEYDAYGNTISATNAQAYAHGFRFSSKCFDFETSLYYYGFRYFSPSMGRWLSMDPFFELLATPMFEGVINTMNIDYFDRIGPNDFQFLGNNALNLIDHLGLIDFSCQTIRKTDRKDIEISGGEYFRFLGRIELLHEIQSCTIPCGCKKATTIETKISLRGSLLAQFEFPVGGPISPFSVQVSGGGSKTGAHSTKVDTCTGDYSSTWCEFLTLRAGAAGCAGGKIVKACLGAEYWKNWRDCHPGGQDEQHGGFGYIEVCYFTVRCYRWIFMRF